MTAVVDYSPTDPDVLADPYPYYVHLRRGPAATYVSVDDLWVISRFDEVGRALRDPATYSSKALWALFGGMVSARERERVSIREFAATQPKSLIAMDPPDHIPLRRMSSKMFTKSAVHGYAPMVREICNKLVDDMLERREASELDLVGSFHHPLPVRVIASILGIHSDRLADFKRWSDILINRLSGQGDSIEEQADLKMMMEYFGVIITERKARRGSDLVSLILTNNEEAGELLTDWDLFNFCALLLSAGNETTTNLLGNLFCNLFAHPDQYEKVKLAADLQPAVEEILRYEPTVQGVVRLTNEPVDLGDTEIPADSIVIMLTASANRDESRWERPDVFDVERPLVPHFGFGTGIHHCLGAALARLETEIGTDVLRRRTAHIEPVADPVRTANVILRGVSSMPVKVTAR